MGKAELIKETIIQKTIELLKNSNGKIQNITIRNIAENSGAATGLINYHFSTKDKLVEICIQRIIGEVINVFRPQVSKGLDGIERLKEVAGQVTDFLMENPEISKISILGDMATPMLADNTMKTVRGFMTALNLDSEETKQLTFCFTLVLQGIFLRKDTAKEALGIDFNNKSERNAFINIIIDRMYGKK